MKILLNILVFFFFLSLHAYEKRENDSIVKINCILKIGHELVKQSDGYILFNETEIYFSYEAGNLKIYKEDYSFLEQIQNGEYLNISIKIYQYNFVDYEKYDFKLKKENLFQRYLIIEIFKCRNFKEVYDVFICSPLFYDLKPSKIYKNGTINCSKS